MTSEDDAWRMIQDISKLLYTTGFKILKGNSNSKVILKRAGNDYLTPTLKVKDMDHDGLPQHKALGKFSDAESVVLTLTAIGVDC